MLFEKEIVSSGDVVMFVGLNATLGMFCIEAKLLQSLQHVPIDRYAMEPDDDSAMQGDISHLLAPLVGEYLIDLGSFRGIYT